MSTYNVYLQAEPTKKSRGPGIMEFHTNFQLLGQIEARNSEHAFTLARRYCNHPVIEKVTLKKKEEKK